MAMHRAENIESDVLPRPARWSEYFAALADAAQHRTQGSGLIDRLDGGGRRQSVATAGCEFNKRKRYDD